MSLVDVRFELSYNNQECDVVRSFFAPALKEAIEYDRAVGFFSSTSLMSMSVGIKKLVQNGGKIKLICSPKLSEEDIIAIESGYERRKIIENAINREFVEPKDEFEAERLNILSHLISEGIMDIKIASMKSSNEHSMFHAKIGIIGDANGNYVVFNGSMNESSNAFYGNGESIDVYTSFGSDFIRANEKKQYFNNLWNNNEKNVEIVEFPESTIERINNYRRDEIDLDIDKKEKEAKEEKHKKKKEPQVPSYVKIRDYQEDAYNKWKEKGYRGIYDMATGTGKTYTALYSMIELLNEKNQELAIIICCPYQHLVNQWSEDLDEFGFDYIVGFSESKQKDWKKRLRKASFDYSHRIIKNFCLITTNASFAKEYIQETISSINREILIVIDEAHNFGTARLVRLLDDRFNYRLALSATLERNNDLVGTQRLYDFFGGKCIEYTLEMAIEAGMLCRYYYYPIKVYFDEEEYEKYIQISNELRKYIKIDKNGSVIYGKKAEMLLIKRARLVAGTKMKLEKLKEIAGKHKNDCHLLVYCGATTVVDPDYEESKACDDEIRQVDAATKILQDLGITCSKFTSTEDTCEREVLRKEFDSGDVIKALVAIRCLDEGVNIPSIDKAIIMASSTNPKEYIQRRGRVLRTYNGKSYATIYDFVTLPRHLDDVSPSSDLKYDLSLIKREIVRVKDFSRLSLNEYDSDELINEIENVYGVIKEGDYNAG
ncbi:MAG: DEAD/DEAH box helicase family protein [Erysipelotrichaceae bacterium]